MRSKEDIEAQFAREGIAVFSKIHTEGLGESLPTDPQVTTFTLKQRSTGFHGEDTDVAPRRSLGAGESGFYDDDDEEEEDEEENDGNGGYNPPDDEFDDPHPSTPPDYFVQSSPVASLDKPEVRLAMEEDMTRGKQSKKEDTIVEDTLRGDEAADLDSFGRQVAAAEKLVLCALDETHADKRLCVTKLRDLAEKYLDVPVEEIIQRVMAAYCAGEHVANCGGLLNALAVFANSRERGAAAQKVLARFLLRASVPYLPVELNAGIASIDKPSHELLHALAERVVEPRPPVGSTSRRGSGAGPTHRTAARCSSGVLPPLAACGKGRGFSGR